MVLERIAEFLAQLLGRHDAMSTSLATILDKLTDQGTQLDAQGSQIEKLIADRDAKEQADLDKISALLDTNASKSEANAAKVAAALAPASEGVTGQAPASDPSTPISTVVTAPVDAGSTTIPVAQASVADISSAAHTAAASGDALSVSGSAIASGSTVVGVDTSASTVTLSHPTTDAHVGDGTETLTLTPAAT